MLCRGQKLTKPGAFGKFSRFVTTSTESCSYNVSELEEWKQQQLHNPPVSTHDMVSISPAHRLLTLLKRPGEKSSGRALELDSLLQSGQSHSAICKKGYQLHDFGIPCAHWLYHLNDAPTHKLAIDGHQPSQTPPPPFGPRMYAGSTVNWVSPLVFGEATRQDTTVKNIEVKNGRNGPLVFVTLERRTMNADTQTVRIVENQKFAYKWLDPDTEKIKPRPEYTIADQPSGKYSRKIEVVIQPDFYSREQARSNPDTLYLFGENDRDRLLKPKAAGDPGWQTITQAVIRGEPNAFGIRTVWYTNLRNLMYDDTYQDNIKAISEDFSDVRKALSSKDSGFQKLVIPEAGLGTGIANLQQGAPKTFQYLTKQLDDLAEGLNQSQDTTADVEDWRMDPLTLLRFSALTFNAHRIHWDLPYSQSVEGYPALVVQGTLTANLMLKHFCDLHPGATLQSFDHKAVSPLFCEQQFQTTVRPHDVDNKKWDLSAKTLQNKIAMKGVLTVV